MKIIYTQNNTIHNTNCVACKHKNVCKILKSLKDLNLFCEVPKPFTITFDCEHYDCVQKDNESLN